MKILFDSYVTINSSESSYFNAVLRMAKINSMFWSDKKISTFDVLDATTPDVFVTHYRSISEDLIKYLSGSTNINLVLNISGSTDSEVEALEGFLSQKNINCSLMFSGDINPSKGKTYRFEEILPAADLFFPMNAPSQRKIDYGVICQSVKNDLVQDFIKDKDVYHTLGANANEVSDTDLQVNVKTITDISHLYQNLVLIGDIRFVSSQMFFDCMLRANKCTVRTDNKEGWDNFLKRIFDVVEGDDMKEILRSQILQKHTCYNRAERLMKFLGNSDAMKAVQKLRNNPDITIGQ